MRPNLLGGAVFDSGGRSKNMSIQFTDICFISNDVLGLRSFYEALFSGKAEGDEIHSTLRVVLPLTHLKSCLTAN